MYAFGGVGGGMKINNCMKHSIDKDERNDISYNKSQHLPKQSQSHHNALCKKKVQIEFPIE